MNKFQLAKSRFKKSNDAQVVARNFGYMLFLQIASYAFPLITIPYLARVIGVEGFGKIAFAAAVILWFQTVTEWGFGYTATRDVAKNKNDLIKISEIFSNVLWTKIILMIFSLIVLSFLIIFIPIFQENKNILLITFLLIPGNIFFPEWFFQALERMKFITYFGVISKFIFTILVFVFVNDQGDYLLQPLFISMGLFFCGLVSFYLIVAKWGVRIRAPRWKDVFLTIKSGYNVFLNNIFPNLYNSFSTVFLGLVAGSASTGILEAGKKFSEIAQQFLNVISKVFFPLLSRNIKVHDAYGKIQISLSVCCALVIFFFAPYLIDFFYTADFNLAAVVLQIMSISIVFQALNSVYGTNYLIVLGYEMELRRITTGVSILGFVFSLFFVYYFDIIGAAVSITLARGFLGVGVLLKAIGIKNKKLKG
ncbi:flippase [Comamonas aquatica]|uniref:flippase n=1 Tax=Comamonas aquatica TaxID=225991 RepID=UPI00320ABF81